MTVFGHSVSFNREFTGRRHYVGEDSDALARHIGIVLKNPSRCCLTRRCLTMHATPSERRTGSKSRPRDRVVKSRSIRLSCGLERCYLDRRRRMGPLLWQSGMREFHTERRPFFVGRRQLQWPALIRATTCCCCRRRVPGWHNRVHHGALRNRVGI